MRALVQRVANASVIVEEDVVGEIQKGLVVFLGIGQQDREEDAGYVVEKVANLRIFEDGSGRFNNSALDMVAHLLLISQFTLYADVRKGRRPSFEDAASPEEAKVLFEKTVDLFRETGLRVETGRFQKHMTVDMESDGPVTIMVDSADRYKSRRSKGSNQQSRMNL